MKQKDMEKMYSLVKMEEYYISDLCSEHDERVFKYASECCGAIVEPYDYNLSKEIKKISLDTYENYSKTKDPSIYNEFLLHVRKKLQLFYQDVLSKLKKTYVND